MLRGLPVSKPMLGCEMGRRRVSVVVVDTAGVIGFLHDWVRSACDQSLCGSLPGRPLGAHFVSANVQGSSASASAILATNTTSVSSRSSSGAGAPHSIIGTPPESPGSEKEVANKEVNKVPSLPILGPEHAHARHPQHLYWHFPEIQ